MRFFRNAAPVDAMNYTTYTNIIIVQLQPVCMGRSPQKSKPPQAKPNSKNNNENNWLARRLAELSEIGGYQKPDLLAGSLKLDSNENYVIPKQFQSDIIIHARRGADVREYPLGGTDRLIAAISKALKTPSSMVAVGNGSDQLLDLLLGHLARRITGTKKEMHILTSDPTFGFFEDRCRLYGIPLIRVPFEDGLKLDASAVIDASKDADILYLDSPNNPTGFQFSKPDMQRIIRNFEHGLVIIDEAYGEFGDYTVSGMARRHNNLIIIRTLSKSFGLAGLRLGYMIANRNITSAFTDVIQYPYPLGTISIEAGIEALRRMPMIHKTTKMIKAERARIISTLKEHDAFEVFDSNANFVLFDARGAYKRVHSALAEQGISIRRLGKVGPYDGCLRVTVGTREMNSRFLLAIRDLLG